MISVIVPINHPQRVEQLNTLYRRIKKEAGIPVEVLVACDNPQIYLDLEYDKLVQIPKRIGFTQSVNLAEKFSTYDIVWYMDDSVTPVENWAKIAYEEFYKRFPDGLGLLEISGVRDCAARCITTKQYTHPMNLGYMLWPEYLHCGDTEHYERAIPQKTFSSYSKTLLQETKVNDASRKRNMKVFGFDDMIRNERRQKGWPLERISGWDDKLYEYCKNDPDLLELCVNILNIKNMEVGVRNK
jgi:hypothetical protein